MTEDIRASEFPQLNSGVFADYSGSFPMCQSSARRIAELNSDFSMFYPANDSPIDREIEQFKAELLSFFNTTPSSYTVFFSSNTSQAIRALAYAFPWTKQGKFIYHVDNHNSILGIRKVANKNLADLLAVGSFPKDTGTSHSLFAFSAQSNFGGAKLPLDWVDKFQSMNPPFTHVLLDVAGFAPTCKLDLSVHSADFVVFSLLKTFGIGGGALLVRNSALPLLLPLSITQPDKILLSAARAAMKVRNSIEEALGISPSLHVYKLAESFVSRMSALKHFNGEKVCSFYPSEFRNYDLQGGVVAFNLFSSTKGPIAHEGVYLASVASQVFVRFGVHCNPGATYMALGWKPNEIKEATSKHEAACSLTASIINGKHVGTIRASFGITSTMRDVDKLVEFFEAHFVEKESRPTELHRANLFKAFVHPIKGCRGFEIPSLSWKMVNTGLQFDEGWAIADEMSTLLDRRRCPRLAMIKTKIENEELTVEGPDGRSISVSAFEVPRGTDFTSSTVCHEKIKGSIYGKDINAWFSEELGQRAVFVKVSESEVRPFRAMFTASLHAVGDPEIERLRPHFIFETSEAFAEDSWVGTKKNLGELNFTVSRRLPLTTEVTITSDGGEDLKTLRDVERAHSRHGYAELGLELHAEFKPSRKNPKSLAPGFLE